MLRLSAVAAMALCDAGTALLSGGSLALYSGTPLVDPDVPITTELELVRFPLKSPAFLPAVMDVDTAAAPIDPPDPVIATASGNASFFRFYDSVGTAVYEGTVSLTSGLGDMRLPTVAVVAGVSIAVTDYEMDMDK